MKNDSLILYNFPGSNVLLESRLHLNQAKVQHLKNAIESEWQAHLVLDTVTPKK